jgi:hypothetical protein
LTNTSGKAVDMPVTACLWRQSKACRTTHAPHPPTPTHPRPPLGLAFLGGAGASPFLALGGCSTLAMPLRMLAIVSSKYLQCCTEG